MENCAKCGAKAAAEAKFCKACGAGMNAADNNEKKARVLGSGSGSRRTPAIIAAAVIFAVAAIFAYSSYGKMTNGGAMRLDAQRSAAPESAFTPVQAKGGEIRIAEDSLKGSAANYYTYAGPGKAIKFFVLKAADGTVRVALDACAACYHAKLGYSQNGDTMVCNNCGMGFRSTDVGKVTGGCSPIPVQRKVDGKMIVVKVADLESGEKYF
ncbi:MAG: DUF2318 domain-containing protein [Nitrospirota bacterium]|nr:DUF2318 domain-containing protein [Nitrospirota bacterium]